MDRKLLHQALDALTRGECAVLATVVRTEGSVPRPCGAKLLFKVDETIVGSVGGGAVEAKVIDRCREVLETGIPETVTIDITGRAEGDGICGGQVEVFLDPLGPKWQLIVVGAGHVGQAVASLAADMGDFRVIVLDDREDLGVELGQKGVQRIVNENVAETLSSMKLTAHHAVVIVSRGHALDEDALAAVAQSAAIYIGMMGSRRKVAQILKNLRDKGISKEALDKIYAPIGLDIQAITPAELAVSILAEILAVTRSGTSQHCRNILPLPPQNLVLILILGIISSPQT